LVRETTYRIYLGKPHASLGRPNRRWEDNIEVDLKATGYESLK
jgi:hypothetical protein